MNAIYTHTKEFMKEFFHNHSDDLLKGTTGLIATVSGIGLSLQDLEAGLRIASLCVGITVGILTAWSIIRKNRRDKE
jgi:hypothetical protein